MPGSERRKDNAFRFLKIQVSSWTFSRHSDYLNFFNPVDTPRRFADVE